jgi:hypothetical protein
MANNYGAFSELPKPKGNDYGAYLESRPIVFSNSPKPRKKASDTSKMNSLYKPKASPGPIASASNVREGRSTNKTTMSNFTYSAPKADKPKATRPMKESTRPTKSTPKAKSKNVAGFKPGSIGANAISGFKKAYLGK